MKEGHLEPGRYRILNAASSDVVNIIRRRSTEEPTICTWNAHNSYTDKWLLVPVAEGGYYIRNEASGHYFSLARPSSVLNDGDPVIGSTTPTKWAIGKNDSSFR
ncbi:hypothetical protein FRC03_006152 [Tulasnella sp. 419]|nr:hypothetical protein FRC03_006152 [Tulasnella sp. 419]